MADDDDHLRQIMERIRLELQPSELAILEAMVEGQSTTEISANLDIPVGSVKVRLARLRKTIRDRAVELQGGRMSQASLSVYIDPGDASEELLTEFLIALSSVYRAYGGSGLTIVSDESRAIVGEVV